MSSLPSRCAATRRIFAPKAHSQPLFVEEVPIMLKLTAGKPHSAHEGDASSHDRQHGVTNGFGRECSLMNPEIQGFKFALNTTSVSTLHLNCAMPWTRRS